MDNIAFYNAIKKTIDYYRINEKSGEGFDIIKTEFKNLEEKEFEQYRKDFDYRKIFLRSYYRRYLDTSPSLDFEGKEINWEERMVADIMFRNLLEQLENKMDASKYCLSGDINYIKYQALLNEHNICNTFLYTK